MVTGAAKCDFDVLCSCSLIHHLALDHLGLLGLTFPKMTEVVNISRISANC